MASNYYLCFQYKHHDGSWGFANVEVYMEQVSVICLEKVRRALVDKEIYKDVIILNLIPLAKQS